MYVVLLKCVGKQPHTKQIFLINCWKWLVRIIVGVYIIIDWFPSVIFVRDHVNLQRQRTTQLTQQVHLIWVDTFSLLELSWAEAMGSSGTKRNHRPAYTVGLGTSSVWVDTFSVLELEEGWAEAMGSSGPKRNHRPAYTVGLGTTSRLVDT